MLSIWIVLLNVATVTLASPLDHRALTPDLVKLSFALAPEDVSLLEKTILDISHPDSENYGRYLSGHKSKALLEPAPEVSQLVKQFLRDIGAEQVEADGQWIHASIAPARWQSLRNKRHDSPPEHAGLDLPPSLASHVQLVHYQSAKSPLSVGAKLIRTEPPLQLFSGPAKSSPPPPANVSVSQCAAKMTPACLRRLYHMDGDDWAAAAASHDGSLFGIVGFDRQAAQHKELAQFLEVYAPYAVGADFSTSLVHGGANIQDNAQVSGEANADVQYAIAMGHQVPVRFYSVGGENHKFIPDLDLNDTNLGYIEPMLPLVSYLLDLPDATLPQTISISYGVNEQLVPIHYARQVCAMLGQLGARGVSIITSSGDGGPGASCQSNGASGKTEPGAKRLLPFWPASCPYVTAVGSTELVGAAKLSTSSSRRDHDEWEEQGAFFSGGGFSDFFARPSWQKGIVEGYVRGLGDRLEGLYNPHGRAVPDVSVNGCDEPFYNHGKEELFSGTSVSAPIFAGLIARLNNQRLQCGKAPLGFLNPWIYSTGKKGFTDIKKGASSGCKGTSYSGTPSPVISGAGWNASSGWDAITGIGTPNFQKLKALVRGSTSTQWT